MKSLYVWGLAAPGSEGSVDGASSRGFLRFLSLTGPVGPRVEVSLPEAAMNFLYTASRLACFSRMKPGCSYFIKTGGETAHHNPRP